MGYKFIWGEVKELNGDEKTATYKPMFQSGREPRPRCEVQQSEGPPHMSSHLSHEETIDFDYCLICAGCNFGPFHKLGPQLPQLLHPHAALASRGGVSPCGSPPSMKTHGQKAF